MVNIIVGDNAVGKTRSLDIIYNMHKNEAVTNFLYDCKSRYVVLDQAKIDQLDDVVDNIKTTNNQLLYAEWCDALGTEILDSETLNVLSLLCKDRRYILLDEPERCIDDNQLKAIIWFLSDRKCSDEVWLTTHSFAIVTSSNANYYKIGSNSELVRISKEEAYECVDPI